MQNTDFHNEYTEKQKAYWQLELFSTGLLIPCDISFVHYHFSLPFDFFAMIFILTATHKLTLEEYSVP